MELIIPIDTKSGRPLYEQIYEYIKHEIKCGNIEPDKRLPSTRKLAENMGVSRSTTQLAYDQLYAEGYIESEPYKGYYAMRLDGIMDVRPKTDGEFITRIEQNRKSYIDFSVRGIDLDNFPYNIWRKISRDTLADNKSGMFLNGDHQGELGLRQAIGSYLHYARGVNCNPDQIIVGAGSEYLLMLLKQILGNNKNIAMENPTYKQAFRVLNGIGYNVIPVSMDKYGMSSEQLEKSDADIAYVMPSHQFPTGIIMPIKRRQEILYWASKRTGRYIIEDDYDSEFRYKGKPIPAMQGSDYSEKVIYIGTFSKSIAPAIRVGYMVLPEELLKIYREKAGFFASTVSRIDQNILYKFITGGFYERHLNHMRAVYKSKHETMISAIRIFENEFEITGEFAGLHILMTHRGNASEAMLIEAAKKNGVRIYGLSDYYIAPEKSKAPATVMLGYAGLKAEEILNGVKSLEEAWLKR